MCSMALEVDAPAPVYGWIVAKAGALVFACPRDNGANELRRIFREGSPSETGRNANHAITEKN